MNFSSQEREAYEDHLKWLMIEANSLKKRYEQGLEEGRAEGIVEGIEKGRAEGIVEGIEKTALSMLKQKLDNKLISSVTGLSLEEIVKLKNSI
jgi:predicted transposase YdaD